MNDLLFENVKFVIGNGFDLYCGLNTRYGDFFDSKMDTYIRMEDFKYSFNLNERRLNRIIIMKMKEFLRNNDFGFWDFLFYFDPDRKNKNLWCDVELFLYNFFNTQNNEKSLFDIVYDCVKRKTISSNDSEWLDLPIIYLLAMKSTTITKIDFATFLLDELQKFEKEFGEYIEEEFKRGRKRDYQQKANNLLRTVLSYSKNICIDTFNYTMIENIFTKYPINHINGNHENPIFGIDATIFNNLHPEYIFSKSYRRMTADFLELERVNGCLNRDFDALVIFGHSLNEQDYSYYFPIFDYMGLLDITSKKTIVFLYNIYEEGKRRKIKNDNIKNLLNMLNAYEKTKTGKVKDYRLMDTLTATDRIIFKEIKSIDNEIRLNYIYRNGSRYRRI